MLEQIKQPQRVKMTAQAFEKFIAEPQNAGKQFEYIHGEAVEKVASATESSEIALEIGYHLKVYLKQNKIGRITGADGGYMINNNRYIPDVSYMHYDRFPGKNETWVSAVPDLVVEVLSPSDRVGEVVNKISDYVNAGAVVWLVDPDTETISIHAPEKDTIVLHKGDILPVEQILPGLEIPISEIFSK